MDERKPERDGSMMLIGEKMTVVEARERSDRELMECRAAIKQMVEGKLLMPVAWALVELIMTSETMRQQFNLAMFSWTQSAAEERELHEAMGKPKGSA